MTFIDTVSPDDASGPVAAFYEQDRAEDGYVWNMTQAFSSRPDVLAAWKQLNTAVRSHFDLRRYELVTIAAARALRSSYCMLAHGKVLLDELLTPDELGTLVADHHAAGLAPVEVAIMDLAEKVVVDATSVTQADADGLREHGLSDPEILDVVLAAAIRCFLSKTLDAVGAQPDAAFEERIAEPELRAALAVGRPIAES
jgi:uncharacterized peroxidase-related enzyme